jgi:hypothetical protein
VSAQIAAPTELLRAGTSTCFPLTLASALVERLARNDIRCCEDWRRLTRRQRLAIWGLTAAKVREIDIAVAQVLP